MGSRSLIRALRAAAAAVVFLGAGLYAATPKSEVYTINVKPPSVSIIDSENWKLLATVPVDPSPNHAVADRKGKSLYVLHNGWLNDTPFPPSDPSTITVIDLATQKVVRTIKVGWHAYKLSFVKDGRYLLCFTRGFSGSKKVQKESGAVTIIDIEKADSLATLSAGRLGKEVLFSKDGNKVFVLCWGEAADKKKNTPEVKPALTVFELEREKPLAEVELPQEIHEMTLSRDERWLYLLDAGVASKNPKKHRNGTVHVFDTDAMKLCAALEVGVLPRSVDVDPTSEYAAVLSQVSAKDSSGKLYLLKGNALARSVDVGVDPRFLKRPENQPGRFVLSHGDMRFLDDGGALATSFIPLNKAKNAPPAGAEVKHLGGDPGEVLALPGGQRVAMTVNDALGAPTSKVAILNLKTNQVEKIVTTGRGGVKFGKFMGAMALSVAMTSLSYYANYSVAQATGQPYFFYNVYVFTPRPPNLSLAASADGKTLYALNTSTNDVTMIDVPKGEVLGHVAVGGGARQVMLAPGGRFVCAYSNKEITFIDTETNKQHSEHHTDGKVMTVSPDAKSGRVLALLSNGLQVWDANEGKLITTVSGLKQARFLAHSAAQE